MTMTFAPPAPGAWELERTHLTRPVSVLMGDVFPANMMRGFAEGTRFYGVLLDHLDVAVINRFMYMCPRPAGAPKTAKGPPPKLVFKLLQHVNPELRTRIRRAEATFRDRLWRQEVTRWHEEVKPAIASEARQLHSEDVASLPMPALVAHVRRAVDFLGRTIYWHHRFNCCTMIPTGDFIVQTAEWTGLPPAEILQALRGSSPVSAGATDELAALRSAIRSDGQALSLLLSDDDPDAVLQRLRDHPGPVGPAAAAYLDLVGLRVLGGYDIADRHAREHPDLLLKIIRAAVTQDRPMHEATAEQTLARLRDRVPTDRRDQFDDLLREALLTYPIRDERVFHADALGAGVARRAVLEAGSRLHRQQRIADPSHLVDATLYEIASMLEASAGPSAGELADRVRFRTETSLDSAPPNLGFAPSQPPPAEWLPPAAARLQRSTGTVLALMFAAREEQTAGKTLKGFAASPGTYEGPARVIATVAELPAVQPGEVLITRSTGPTYNIVLPLIGAIVTERGGALCHAAIVAREYGLPAVVGCGGAMRAIATGARVRVDGERGEVWLLD